MRGRWGALRGVGGTPVNDKEQKTGEKQREDGHILTGVVEVWGA